MEKRSNQPWSQDFDVVGANRQHHGFHDRVLGQLLGIIAGSVARQNESTVTHGEPKITQTALQPSENLFCQLAKPFRTGASRVTFL